MQKIKISIRDWWRDEAALGCVTMDNVGKGSTPLIQRKDRTQILIIANRNKAHQGNCLVKEKKRNLMRQCSKLPFYYSHCCAQKKIREDHMSGWGQKRTRKRIYLSHVIWSSNSNPTFLEQKIHLNDFVSFLPFFRVKYQLLIVISIAKWSSSSSCNATVTSQRKSHTSCTF